MELLCKVSEKTSSPSERFHLTKEWRSRIAALAGSGLTAGGVILRWGLSENLSLHLAIKVFWNTTVKLMEVPNSDQSG